MTQQVEVDRRSGSRPTDEDWIKAEVVARYLDETLTGPQCLKRLRMRGMNPWVTALDDAAAALRELRALEDGTLSAADLFPGSRGAGRHEWAVTRLTVALEYAVSVLARRTS